MKELVEWLIEMEEQSARLYRESAALFGHDEKAAPFFEKMVLEEENHLKLVSAIRDYIIREEPNLPSAITLDGERKERLLGTFRKNLDLLDGGKLTYNDLLSCVASTELSEWNDMFVYTMNSMKERGALFQKAAAQIEGHKQRVLSFLRNYGESEALVESLQALPEIWHSQILIVEDDSSLLTLLKSLLSGYNVDTAKNGREGLEKIKERYYDVVISDVDMPLLDGMEMFDSAETFSPDIANRWIFMSGAVDARRMKFFSEKNVEFLRKPYRIDQLMERIAARLSGSMKQEK